MRRNLCLIAALALLVPAMGVAENYSYRYRGNSAYLSHSSTDGCISTWFNVSFAESRSQDPPGSPDAGATLQVFVSQFDWCRYVFLVDIFGQAVLPREAFQVNSLQSARLNTTIQGYDNGTGATVPIVIDLTWSGTGSPTRSHNSSWSKYPTYTYRSRSTGDIRDADVSGSIAAGTLTLSPSPTPGASYGELSLVSHGIVTITR